jgi:hypothetical protein
MQINVADVSMAGQDRACEFVTTPDGAVEGRMMNVTHGLIVPPWIVQKVPEAMSIMAVAGGHSLP